MKPKEYPKELEVYFEDDNNSDHIETYEIDLACDEQKCQKVGAYVNHDNESDRPMCLECIMKNEIFDRIQCNRCKKMIYNKHEFNFNDSSGFEYQECNCIRKKVKAKKEKPILECMWVRARDYQ